MRILVVEDETALAAQLESALTAAGYAVDRAASGDRADYLARTEDYDAVLLDLGLPRVDGLTLLRQWRDAGMSVPVLVLTARGSWSEKVHGIDSGADDYVAKPYRVEEVLARTRALIRRAHGHAAPQLRCGGVTLDPRLSVVTLNGTPVTLTSHEYKTLSYLMHQQGRVVSRGELTEHIYAQNFERDSNTVEVFVARLRRKLGPSAHRDGARAWLPHGRGPARHGAAGVKARASFRSQLAIGSVLWTLGLLVAISMLAIHLLANNPRPHQCDLSMVLRLAPGRGAGRRGGRDGRRRLADPPQPRPRWHSCTRASRPCTAARTAKWRGRYPSEVQPLVDDLNALLAERDQRVQRALAKAGDLAHGLKTPLAVLARDAERVAASGDHELAASMAAQVERMRRQIDYHLAHTRAAAAGTGPGTRSLVASSVDGLIRTLERLHAERAIALRSAVPPGHAVRCRREDLDEMLGNLLDNACKWGRSRVEVESRRGGLVDRHHRGR